MSHLKNGDFDIIDIILEDHKPLKTLIKIMKDEDATKVQKQKAFEQFVPLLTIHAKAEEKALYVVLKKRREMRDEGLEGQFEHDLADQVVKMSKQTQDKDILAAKIKVLAELVEHHIEEEESEVFKDYRKNSTLEERAEIGRKYLGFKQELSNQKIKNNKAKQTEGYKALFSSNRALEDQMAAH